VSATATDPGAAGARELVALAHEQLDLVEHGRTDELAAIDARREAIMARLPRPLSPAARELLAEAIEAQRQVAAALSLGMARLREEMGRVSHGRIAMAGYAPAGMDARPVLDRSA
jgi:hypothetical protein